MDYLENTIFSDRANFNNYENLIYVKFLTKNMIFLVFAMFQIKFTTQNTDDKKCQRSFPLWKVKIQMPNRPKCMPSC